MKIESTELTPCVELEMSRMCTSVCSDKLHDTGAYRSLTTSVKLVGWHHTCPVLTLSVHTARGLALARAMQFAHGPWSSAARGPPWLVTARHHPSLSTSWS